MFLRRFERKRRGKRHTYWALVESYRTGKGSRQRIVAYLGELKGSEQNGWSQLGRQLDKKDRPQPSLFDPPEQEHRGRRAGAGEARWGAHGAAAGLW